jgi:hypothetical protein
VPSTQQYEHYIGLPTLIGRSKVSTFNGIKGMIWSRMNGWKEKFLSHSGKEILLKAVLQAIPTYSMSVFQLPKTLCQEINLLMAKFWWGQKENTFKISWLRWNKLGRNRNYGGLGYRDLEAFNLAFLAKQGWCFLQHPETFVSRVYREKYFPGGNFLDSQLGRRPSFAWRSIWNSGSLIKDGLLWKVGKGDIIRIWGDRWLPTDSHELYPHSGIIDSNSTVNALINQEANWCNIPIVESIFPTSVAARICSIAISPRSQHDKLIWSGTKNEAFSVRSAYLEVERTNRRLGSGSRSMSDNPFWKLIWRLRVPRAVLLFPWRGCNNILPIKEKLFQCKIVSEPFCPQCGVEVETACHFLWRCASSTVVWAECSRSLQKSIISKGDFLSIFHHISTRVEVEDLELMVVTSHVGIS